jgi:hypothetical protein
VPDRINAVADYFNLLASRVQESRLLAAPPACTDLSRAALRTPTSSLDFLPFFPHKILTPRPPASSTLPPPSPGLTLRHIAIGRGTQNYTCDPATPDAAPKAVGALATLFNATCLAANDLPLASSLARAALQFDLAQSQASQKLTPADLAVSGRHLFLGDGTPFFDLDVAASAWQLGQLPCGKNGTANAPADALKGLQGEVSVPWLKLVAKPGATGGLQEVYRVETVGGSAPATCQGQAANIEVQYAAL